MVGYFSKTGPKPWTHWRVYLALVPGLNIFILGWYVVKLFKPKWYKAHLSRLYLELPKENAKKDEVLRLASELRQSKVEYSSLGREYFYSHGLRGFGSNLPQLIMQLAFVFRTGFCSDWFFVVFFGDMYSLTFVSIQVFYFLPRKYFDPIPDIIPYWQMVKLFVMFMLSNLARMYTLVYLATYTRHWTFLFYVIICLFNLALSMDELKKNPKYTTLFILFSPISPCILPSQCKTADSILLSLGITLTLLPYVPFLVNTDVTNNPPITLCHTAAGNFSGDWVRCPASYLNESGPTENCVSVFRFGGSHVTALFGLSKASEVSNYDHDHEDYITFCQHEEFWHYVKYGISAVTTLISLTFFPYLADYFNHPDSFTGSSCPKQAYKKVTALLSKNIEVMYLRPEHEYMNPLLKRLYLGRMPPKYANAEEFTMINSKFKEITGFSLLQWSMRESYFHLARYYFPLVYLIS